MVWFTELPGRRRYSRVSTGVPPALRWWRWWSTRWLFRTSLRRFLRTRRGESCWGENRTFFFIPGVLWRGAGEAEDNGAGADGAGANGAGDDRGLPRRGGCWGVTGWSESTGLSRSIETESDLEPISTRKFFGYLERTRYGPLYNGDNGGFDASSLIKTWEQETKLKGIWSGFVAGTAEWWGRTDALFFRIDWILLPILNISYKKEVLLKYRLQISMYNHMVGRAASVIPSFPYSILCTFKI